MAQLTANYETVMVLSMKNGEEGVNTLVEKFNTLITDTHCTGSRVHLYRACLLPVPQLPGLVNRKQASLMQIHPCRFAHHQMAGQLHAHTGAVPALQAVY